MPGSGATLKALIVLRSSLLCFWLQGETYPSSSSRNQLRIMGTRPVKGKKTSGRLVSTLEDGTCGLAGGGGGGTFH